MQRGYCSFKALCKITLMRLPCKKIKKLLTHVGCCVRLDNADAVNMQNDAGCVTEKDEKS